MLGGNSLAARDFSKSVVGKISWNQEISPDISLSKDFENEIRIELGLDPKS